MHLSTSLISGPEEPAYPTQVGRKRGVGFFKHPGEIVLPAGVESADPRSLAFAHSEDSEAQADCELSGPPPAARGH